MRINFVISKYLILQFSIYILGFFLIASILSKQVSAANDSDTTPPDFVINYPLNLKQIISNFDVSGNVELTRDDGFIRVVLIDSNNNEYLVYEMYPLLADSLSFQVSHVCDETCVLPQITADHLRIEGNSASLTVTSVATSDSFQGKNLKLPGVNLKSESTKVKLNKDKDKIDHLTKTIPKKGLRWSAGDTSFSKKTYAEKRKMFNLNPSDHLPNLQGLEYYQGGIFSFNNQSKKRKTTSNLNFFDSIVVAFGSLIHFQKVNGAMAQLPSRWDYRSFQGQNWNTSIKDQGQCGSCWDFASMGAIEGVTNLYYNQHLNIDLSEADVLVCSGAGTCNGGMMSGALNYAKTTGVSDESCLSYTSSVQSCSNKCANWQTRTTKIGGYTTYTKTMTDYETVLKSNIMKNGMLVAGINALNHAMVLVGWQTDPLDNSPIWIFKNSWGSSYGENGYYRFEKPATWIDYAYAVMPPMAIANNPSAQKVCTDNDSDSYCFWGIGAKPASCPAFCNTIEDCNDSDANALGFDSNYNCTYKINPTPEIVPPTAPSNVIARVLGGASPYVELTWTRATDNVGVMGYEIYRDNQKTDFTTTNLFDDVNISPSAASYTYFIKAVDTAGNFSPSSNIITAVIRLTSPTPTITADKPGDANGDNIVDGQDYVKWLTNYDLPISQPFPFYGDFDKNYAVDGRDYSIWLQNYGK